MKYDQYISLIQRLETKAAQNRGLYEFKVFLLTVLGYAYFVGLIFLIVIPMVVLGWLVWIAPEVVGKLLLYTAKLWWAVIPVLGLFFGFIGSAIKSITAKVPDPPGTELQQNEAPKLFDFVEETCRSLKSRKPEKVLITDDFNASVVTMPRFGIFGQKVLLSVGLPIMKALSPDQFRAVLAHEIGHISGKHGRFSKWAYQMREAWGRLIESQESIDHKFASLYKDFVDWFFPYFTAYTFVLMREHEKDADRDAAELVGVKPLGEALLLMEMKGGQLKDVFWTTVQEENRTTEIPTEKLFTRMLGSLAFVDEERISSSLSHAVSLATDFNDTHPSLADRLRMLGYWTSGELPPTPDQAATDAAEWFLGTASERFISQFDLAWDEQASKVWKQRFDSFQESQKRLSELEEKRANDDLTRDEIIEAANRMAEKEGMTSTVPLLLDAAEKFPDDPVVWYNLGVARLAVGDELGLSDLEKAAELDPTIKLGASQVAFGYLRSKGRLDEARKYAVTIDEQNDIIDKAKRERAVVFPEDTFEPHTLTQEFLDSIPKKVAGIDEITALYAVRKKMEYFPDDVFHVLFVETRKKGRLKNRHDADGSTVFKIVRQRLDTGQIHYFIRLTGNFAGTKYYLNKIPGARIFEGPK